MNDDQMVMAKLLLVEIIAAIFIGIPVAAAILYAVGETVEHFTP